MKERPSTAHSFTLSLFHFFAFYAANHLHHHYYLQCRAVSGAHDQSIVDQQQASIEYIVIDGASTDGTLSIIRQYETAHYTLDF